MATVFYANGEVLLDTEHPSADLAILSPKCKVEINRSGSASFTVLPTHWLHDSLEKMKTVITIEEDGDVIFRGRIIDMPSDLYGQIRVTCEGDMSFLIDSIQTPYTGTQTVKEFFTRVIEEHNRLVEPWKRFVVGEVTITEASQSKEFKIEGYQKTSDLLNSELLQEYGGIIRTRTVGGVTYIDYVEDPFTSPNETVNSQEIRFAVNLVDYDEQYPVSDLFTILIPIGRDNLTIASENGGSIYLESSQDVISKYGKIYRMEQWSNITDAKELKATAQVFLDGHARAFPNDLKVRAIDVHHIKDSVERIKMGDRVRARIDPRGISEVYHCLSIDYDFYNPDNTEYWLGTFIPSDKQKGSTAETSHGGGGGGYGGESLSQSSASTSAKANKQQQELQETEQDIRIHARSIDVLLTKTGADQIPDGSDSMYARITADHSQIEAQVTKTTKLETDVGTLTVTSEEIKENVSKVTGDVNNLTTKVGSLEVTSENIVAEVSTARGNSESLSARLTIVDNGIEARAQETNALGTRMTTVETNVEGFTATVNGLDGRISQIKADVDGISISGETISIKGNTIDLSGSVLADKIFAENLASKTLTIGTITASNLKLGGDTVSKHLIGFTNISRSVDFYGSADLSLGHYHSITFSEDGDSIVATIGAETDSAGSDRFSIAATSKYKTDVAAASSNVEMAGSSWNPETGICSIALTNGKSGTVAFPQVSLYASGQWANNKKTVYITSPEYYYIGTEQNLEIDASDVYLQGWNDSYDKVRLPGPSVSSVFTVSYPAQNIPGGEWATTYVLSQGTADGKLYVYCKPRYETGDGSSVARWEVDASALFTRATVTLQGPSETVYVLADELDQGATDYYQAGSAVQYYTAGPATYYYAAGTQKIIGRGTDVQVTKLGSQVKVNVLGNLTRMQYHSKSVTPTKNYYTVESNGNSYFYSNGGQETYYKAGSTDRYYVGNGGEYTVQGQPVTVTPVGRAVTVTPIDATKKLRLASSVRYRAGTPDSTTYYKKK